MPKQENYKKLREVYEKKREAAVSLSEQRRAEIHRAIPEVKELDAALSQTGFSILAAARAGKDGLDARIAKLREENRKLREIRAELLEANGYPADYTEVHYECDICHDTGFDGLKICPCMKKALVYAGFESSGIGHLVARQHFDSFSLDYYKGQDRARMEQNVRIARAFAESFGEGKADHLLFFGGTGLGKTHLSSAVAKVVIERGYDVVYETAQNVFSDFEFKQFRSVAGDSDPTEKYFEAELLIIDDLGTEMCNQFTVSCLYHLINTRLNAQKPMLISTNLSQKELRDRYADRITSRIFGEFTPLFFTGSDVRMEKLKKQ